MKFVVERDKLHAEIAAVVGRTKGGDLIPILSHILIQADGSSVALTGNDLSISSRTSLPADVETAGALAVPGERLHKLVSSLPAGSQIHFAADAQAGVGVRCGRSRYSFSALPASDFPELADPADALDISLTAKQVVRLFGIPSASISTEDTRPQLHGVFLHRVGSRLTGVACNGHTLIRAALAMDVPEFPGVIVPPKTCAELVRMARDGDVVLRVSQTLIAATTGPRSLTSKLIDATYPDYERIIPKPEGPGVILDTKQTQTALARLLAAADPKQVPAAKLAWTDNFAELTASTATQFGSGQEQIDCEGPQSPAGEVGASIAYLGEVMAALGGETTRVHFDGPGSPIRFENPLDDDLLAVVMPCRV